jgi:hypothetical protein
MFFRDGDVETGGFREFFQADARFVDGKSAPQRVNVFVVQGGAENGVFRMQPKRQIDKGFAHGILVCPHKACGAEFDTAEAAGYYADEFAYAAVQQNRQHGAAGRAARFAVVAVCDAGGIAGRACAKSPAVVCGIGMFLALGLDKRAGILGI